MEKGVPSGGAGLARWGGALLTGALTLLLAGSGEAPNGDAPGEASPHPPALAAAFEAGPAGLAMREAGGDAGSTKEEAGGEQAVADPVVGPPAPDRVLIQGGVYVPLYARDDGGAVAVGAFRLDRRAVTRGEFRVFLGAEPRWRSDQAPPVFASPAYLSGWSDSGDDDAQPATAVSWFAAKAYCRWAGGRLPTADEWEYAARADEERADASRDPAFRARALELATGGRGDVPAAQLGFVDTNGVSGLHAPVREWVLDYNSVLVSDDSRGNGARDRSLYCASGASGATDPGDYAAFLRYAFRASLEGASAMRNLGFRCAADPSGEGR